jgi:hypothetical protein
LAGEARHLQKKQVTRATGGVHSRRVNFGVFCPDFRRFPSDFLSPSDWRAFQQRLKSDLIDLRPMAGKLRTRIGIEGLNRAKLVAINRTSTIRQLIDLINQYENRRDLVHVWFDQAELYERELVADYWSDSALFYFTTKGVVPDAQHIAQLLSTKADSPIAAKSAPKSRPAPGVKVFVMFNEEWIVLTVPLTDRVAALRAKIEGMLSVPRDARLCLIFAGRQLEDGKPLRDYCIRDDSTLYLVARLRA